MSSTDPMRDVFSIRSETMRNLSLRPSRFLQMQNTKSSSLMNFDNTSNDVQLLLRAFIEEFAGNCRFIFTCNYKNKILEPLHSRCTVVEFGIRGRDRQTIAAQFFKRIQQILDSEGIEYDNKVLVELINKHFPDWRRVLNECQRYSVSGKIDSGILATFSDVLLMNLSRILNLRTLPKYVSGSFLIWIMILAYFSGVFMILFTTRWFLAVFLLLCLFSLSISIKEHLSQTRR